MALYGLIVWSGWRHVSGQLSDPRLIVAAAAAFPPFWNLVLYGQITIFILIAFWLGWLALERGRAYLAGAAFGLLALKPQFGIPLAAVVLACGEWRMLAGAIGSVAAQAAIVWLAMGSTVFGAFASTLRVTLTYADWLESKPFMSHSLRTVTRPAAKRDRRSTVADAQRDRAVVHRPRLEKRRALYVSASAW